MEISSGWRRARNNGVKLHEYPADWARHGKRAGPLRNLRMLHEGRPDLVLAFHDDIENSKGTAHMVTIAQRAGVDVRLIRHVTEPAVGGTP